jgi:ATP-dependent Lon protease
VAYAIECRRRVKEQMNKRKPDDEFALIDLSYFTADGREIVVYCPESKGVGATQQPQRKTLAIAPVPTVIPPAQEAPSASEEKIQPVAAETALPTQPMAKSALKEQHFTIFYGDTGHSYESIFGPYLDSAQKIVVEDPYIRATHQIQNFVRFCEAVVNCSTVTHIKLITGYDSSAQLAEMKEKLADLKQSLLELDITLEIDFNPNLHDREVRIDNGWVIKIGRGLDFYQRPNSRYEIGAGDLSHRKCLETKVDIFRKG